MSRPSLLPRLTLWFDRRVGRRFYPVHRRLYQLTGGIVGRHSGVGQILLLTTIGRTSGRSRTTPLLFVPRGDAFYVVGSNGARDTAPAWVGNLRATPRARVQIGRRITYVQAEILQSAERSSTWSDLVAAYPGWGYYQAQTQRVLPVVRLTPIPGAP